MRSRLAALLVLSAAPALAAGPQDRCSADIADVRELAAMLPQGDLSRRYAENDLDTARMEMEGGEVDDCPDLVRRARRTIATHPYSLRPGEVSGVPRK